VTLKLAEVVAVSMELKTQAPNPEPAKAIKAAKGINPLNKLFFIVIK
jgi:hypothetical protein